MIACLIDYLKKIEGLRRCGKLWLVTKGDGLEIYDFYNDKKILFFYHDLLYYRVKAWMIIVHDYVILKEF
jgi:predicted AAA+ superfamily ATPase